MQHVQAFSRLVACGNAPLLWHRFYSTQPIRSVTRVPRHEAEVRIGSDTGPNSVRVKFRFFPHGSEDVLATVKYLESIYGPIDEFVCPSLGGHRAWHLFVRFRDYDSASRATKHGELYHRMPAPPMPNEDLSDGGVSLQSLQKYMDVNEQPNLEPDLTPEPDVRYDRHAAREFLYFTIDKTSDVRSAASTRTSSFLSPQATRSFVNWSGFTPIKPLPADTPLLDQGDAVDYPVMRYVVRRYAEMRSMANPLEISTQEQPKRQWVADTVQITSSSTKKAPVKLVEKVAVENKEKLSRVASTPPTPTPTPVVVKPPPASLPPPKAIPSPPSPNSPEALAQLRAANSVLKKLTSQPKAKAKGQGPAQQSRSQHNPPSTQKLKQGGKVAGAPILNKSPQKVMDIAAKGNTSCSTQKATSSSAQGQSKDKAGPAAQSVSGRLQRFMGKFF